MNFGAQVNRFAFGMAWATPSLEFDFLLFDYVDRILPLKPGSAAR
jgi:hypothetical protein